MTRLVLSLALLLALPLSACDTASPGAAGPLPSHAQTAPAPLDPSLGAGLGQTYSFSYNPSSGLDLLFTTSEHPEQTLPPSPIRAATVSGDTDEITSVLYMEWNPSEGGYMMYADWGTAGSNAVVCGFTAPPPAATPAACVNGGVAPAGGPVLLGLAIPEPKESWSEKSDGNGEPGRSWHRHPDGSISFDLQGGGTTTASLHLANTSGVIRDGFGEFLNTTTGTVYVNVLLDSNGENQLPSSETLKLRFRTGTQVTFETPGG